LEYAIEVFFFPATIVLKVIAQPVESISEPEYIVPNFLSKIAPKDWVIEESANAGPDNDCR
jgi:hypothetical protein